MLELKCRHCTRYLGEAETIIGDLICPNSACKGSTQFKIIKSDVYKLVNYKFVKLEREPKKKEVEVS